MSVEHMAWVWRHSQAESGALLVALALADSVNHLDGSDECWPSQELLAKRVRLSERQVGRCINELVELGEIERRRTTNGNRYRFTFASDNLSLGHPRPEDTHVRCHRTPTSGGDQTPTSGAYVEPEVEPEGNRNSLEQQALLTDPVTETWELYVKLWDRPRIKLTAKVRKWIADAHKAVGVDRTRDAIRGHASSQYHRENGYVGIEYAIKPKQGETIDGRIAKMASKVGTGSHDPTTVDRLLARLPSEAQAMVRSWITDVETMLRNPEHRGIAATGQSRVNDLRDKAGMEPVVVGDKIVDWKDVRR